MTKLDISIRLAVPGDMPALDAMMARSYPVLLKDAYPPSVLVTAIPLIARAQPDLVATGTYFVAEDAAGRILGAGGWTPRDPATRRFQAGEASIRHFATDVDHVRCGVGARLMEICVQTAREAGIGRLLAASTLSAVVFYRAQGFTEGAPYTVQLRPGIPFSAVAMSRRI